MVQTRGYGRPFLLIWTFYFLSFVGVYQLLPTVPLHLLGMHAGVAESGRFTTAFMLGSGVGALFTGPLGDRYGQKRVLNLATLLAVVFFGAYAFLSRPWMFLAIGIPHGVVWSGFRTSTLAWVGGYLPEARRAEGLAWFGMAAPGGAAVGPMVGLWLLPRIGFTWLMASIVLLLVGLNALVGRLPEDSGPRQVEHRGYRWPGAWMLAPVGILLCLALSYGPMPAYAAQEARALHMAWPSALLTSYALGMVAMRFLMGWRGMGAEPQRLLVPMLWMTTLAAAGLALIPGGLLRHVISGTFYGAGFGMVHTLLFAHAVARANPEVRGSAIGTQFFAYDMGLGLGSFLMGFPMEHLGFRWGWGLGAIALFSATLVGLNMRRTREL